MFRITTNGVFTSLVLFQGTNGSNPSASLALGQDGNLYGITADGGAGGGGTIFRIVLAPRFTGIARLPGGSIRITGAGLAGSPFQLLAATELSAPRAALTVLTNGVFDPEGNFSFTDNAATSVGARFYRISTP